MSHYISICHWNRHQIWQCTRFFTKFGEEFGDLLNSSKNLVTNCSPNTLEFLPLLIVGICWVINKISIWNYDWRLWEFSGIWKFPGSWTFSSPWKIPGSWIFPGPLENSRGVLISGQTRCGLHSLLVWQPFLILSWFRHRRLQCNYSMVTNNQPHSWQLFIMEKSIVTMIWEVAFA